MGAEATSLSWADKHMLTSIAFQFKSKPKLLNSNVKTEYEISVCIDNKDLHLFPCGFCDVVMVLLFQNYYYLSKWHALENTD